MLGDPHFFFLCFCWWWLVGFGCVMKSLKKTQFLVLQLISLLVITGFRTRVLCFFFTAWQIWDEFLGQALCRDLGAGCSVGLSWQFLGCVVTTSIPKLGYRVFFAENMVFSFKKCGHICQRL